jgi:hypothetical protein
MDISLLNRLMSVSEFGVVLGVVLEGTEYVPGIHRRWPILERIGFMILVLALVADWHFQSKINERHTRELISARTRIAELDRQGKQFSKDAELARRDIAQADERAANAGRDAATAKLEEQKLKNDTAKFEHLLSDREIVENSEFEKLRAFPRTSVWLQLPQRPTYQSHQTLLEFESALDAEEETEYFAATVALR